MSGNLALMLLPDDQRLHVQLSKYFYPSTLAKLRRDVTLNRTGIAVFEVAAPIDAPLIQVAMDRQSAYVLGFRAPQKPHWWAFKEPDKPLPVLPGAPVRSMGLTGSYTELGWPISINMRPEMLLTQLASFSGKPDPVFCQGILLLMFLVAEAMRFDNVLMECVRYLSAGASYAFTIHPAAFKSIINNWNKPGPNDGEVLLPYIPKS